jgi:DNA-binding transcriptional regulator YdaS (Cro superfamily)
MKLSAWLDKQRMSQSDFARLLDVAPPRVHDWLHGKTIPSARSLAAIEAATRGKVRVQDFLGDRE